MLAKAPPERVTEELLAGMVASGRWVFDLKWDGVRALAVVGGGRIVSLTNRDGRDIGLRYPELVDDQVGPELFGDAVVDGELVCLSGGQPDFAAVHRRDAQSSVFMIRRLARLHPVMFMAFDLLALDGEDLRRRPLTDRLVALTKVLGDRGAGRIQPTLRSPDGVLMWQRVTELELEGLVAKQLASRYVAGRSGGGWVKLKNTRRIVVAVSGWTPGDGQRMASFGALLLSLLDDHGNAVEVGKVGTGFTAATLADCTRRLAGGESFVVEVEYLEVGSNGRLRFPVFKRVRDDVALTACTLDQVTRRSEQKGT